MKQFKSKTRTKPEQKIQESIIAKLTLLGWYVKSTHGNIYQFGFPDLYATHTRYGARWIECKNPLAYSFTPAQLDTFPKLVANGSGVWILISDSDDEIKKLFGPCNWYHYLSIMR